MELQELPLWTEIYVQPLDINNMEGSKIYLIKHHCINQNVYNENLKTAINDFIKLWNGHKNLK